MDILNNANTNTNIIIGPPLPTWSSMSDRQIRLPPQLWIPSARRFPGMVYCVIVSAFRGLGLAWKSLGFLSSYVMGRPLGTAKQGKRAAHLAMV